MSQPKEIHLKDYKEPSHEVKSLHLTFDLHDTKTQVMSTMELESKGATSIDLIGVDQNLKSVLVDGKEGQYKVVGEILTVSDLPKSFKLEIHTEINPTANKTLEGLYKSGDIFCTQNEAEGFRRITYYFDRPDVMTKFTTKVIADKKSYPILLSNGNPIGQGDLDNGRHWVEWADPFKKPAYLFALVAGDLGLVTDEYTTISGRKIDLRIYCDKGTEDRCHHAMESLKKSMKWDEDTFGLEYDLDIYMIVSVDSFNMGAMENKGLNIFNSAAVLASRETAPDEIFLRVERVVAHEYFHNWTGNRVTCRDWFQLTLKEGLTVFRDSLFSADMNSAPVKRIADVDMLRSRQFAEDAGPNAHPIKPKSYIKMDNFYTVTVYEKGSEIIRMVYKMLGRDGFRKGMDKYFELYDGQAVTTEDFIHAMSVANNNFDFEQFKLWYDQAGTPRIKADYTYNEKKKTFTLNLTQSCPDTPGQTNKKPFHMPIGVGLVGPDGNDMQLSLTGRSDQTQLNEGILHIKKEKETFVFENVNVKPVPSINRDFTAPINLDLPYTMEDQLFLMANDNDEFNRYEAYAQIAQTLILDLISKKQKGVELKLDSRFVEAFGKLIGDETIDDSFRALSMVLPDSSILHQQQNPIDYQSTYDVCKFVKKELAHAHKEQLCAKYSSLNEASEFKLDPTSMGKRALKNVLLSFISELEEGKANETLVAQYRGASNMTEEMAPVSIMASKNLPAREEILGDFYKKWKDNTLVMQRWLMAQSQSNQEGTLEVVNKLIKDPVYDKTVPNLVRSVIWAFAAGSLQFHNPDGSGYRFVADQLMDVDSYNPQLASRLASTFNDYKKLMSENKKQMKKELDRILAKDGLSKNSYEIISKIVNDAG